MPSLPRGTVGRTGKSSTEGFMVGPDGKLAPLKDMAEMFYRQENSQELPVERAIFLLGRRHLLGKEGKGFGTIRALGKNSPNSHSRGVRSKGEGLRGVGVMKTNRCCQRGLGFGEGVQLLARPHQQ